MKQQPVSSPAQVAANIRNFSREIAGSAELQSRLGQVHAWYALRTGDEWQFGPSKFVGYAGNTTTAYLKTYRESADGRRTERVLETWFSPVDPDSRLGHELFEALLRFLAQWGRAPRKGARFAVVPGDDPSLKTASVDEKLLERIFTDPEIVGGRPAIRGTRMRVADIVEMLAGGATRQELLDDFPYLVNEDISAALAYAARSADHRVIRAA